MPGEQELQFRDVEPSRAYTKLTRPEPRPTTAAERSQRPRTSNPIDDKTMPSLERPNRTPRGGTSEPINRSVVEPVRP